MVDTLNADRSVRPARTVNRLEAAGWLIVAVGVLLQIGHFVGGRAFWLDEAMIALNIRHLSPTELMGRLEYDQVAPIGWLQLEKLASYLPFRSEYALRLPSLVAGLGGLVLFRALARRVLGPWAALAALTLFALSRPLLRYAAEVKPYEVDLFFAVALLLLGVILLARAGRSWGWLVALALTGLVAVTLSLASVFVLAGVGGVLFAHRVIARRGVEAVALGVVGALWMAAFGVLMIWFYAPQTADTVVTTGGAHDFFVRNVYAPFPPTSIGDLKWYATWPRETLQFLFGRDSRFAVGLVIFAGVCLLARRSPWIAAMGWSGLAAGFLASALQLYPLYDRLTLFMLPTLVLTAGAGLDWLVERSRPHRGPLLLLLALMLAGSLTEIAKSFALSPPYSIGDLRPALAEVASERGPADRLYVPNGAIPAFLAYRQAAGLADMDWTAAPIDSQDWRCAGPMMPPAKPGGAVWMLTYMLYEPGKTSADAGTIAGGAPPRAAQADGTAVYKLAARVPGLGAQASLVKICGAPRQGPPSFYPSPRLIARTR